MRLLKMFQHALIGLLFLFLVGSVISVLRGQSAATRTTIRPDQIRGLTEFILSVVPASAPPLTQKLQVFLPVDSSAATFTVNEAASPRVLVEVLLNGQEIYDTRDYSITSTPTSFSINVPAGILAAGDIVAVKWAN